MTNLKDLGPTGYSLSDGDAEARAMMEKFEAHFSEAPPPDAPLPELGELVIEFPDDDPPKPQAAALPLYAREARREPVFAPAESGSACDSARPAASGEGAAATVPAHFRMIDPAGRVGAKLHLLPDLLRSMGARCKSTAIFASIAVALLAGLAGGYIAAKRSDVTAGGAQAGSSPGAGQKLRLDYELRSPTRVR